MVDPLHPAYSLSLTVEDIQGMAISVEKLKDRIIKSVSLLASAKQSALPLEPFGKDKTHMHAIHQKLVHLVGVHRQLLQKFATSEMNAGEWKRRVAVRDDRIKKLEPSNRQIIVSLRKQAEKHVEQLIRLRDQISEIRGAQEAHLQSHGHTEASIIKPFRVDPSAREANAHRTPQLQKNRLQKVNLNRKLKISFNPAIPFPTIRKGNPNSRGSIK